MTTHVVMQWAEARDRGFKAYFTGEPCSRGHVAQRRVVSRSCVQCIRVAGIASKARRRRRDAPAVWANWLVGQVLRQRSKDLH